MYYNRKRAYLTKLENLTSWDLIAVNKFFWYFLFCAIFLLIPWVFAQDSDQSSSDSGILVSSPTQTQNSPQDGAGNSESGDSSSLSDQSNSDQGTKGDNSDNPDGSVSSTDPIIVKSTDAVMFQITANMKLSQDEINAVRAIIEDNIVKMRNLQLSLQSGAIDSKTMYSQRQQLTNDENQKLSLIFTPDQMKIWINMQNN